MAKSLLDLKYLQKPRMTSTIYIHNFNDGLMVFTYLPGGVEPFVITGKDRHYAFARFYKRIREAGFVPCKNVVEKTFNQEMPR